MCQGVIIFLLLCLSCEENQLELTDIFSMGTWNSYLSTEFFMHKNLNVGRICRISKTIYPSWWILLHKFVIPVKWFEMSYSVTTARNIWLFIILHGLVLSLSSKRLLITPNYLDQHKKCSSIMYVYQNQEIKVYSTSFLTKWEIYE